MVERNYRLRKFRKFACVATDERGEKSLNHFKDMKVVSTPRHSVRTGSASLRGVMIKQFVCGISRGEIPQSHFKTVKFMSGP